MTVAMVTYSDPHIGMGGDDNICCNVHVLVKNNNVVSYHSNAEEGGHTHMDTACF